MYLDDIERDSVIKLYRKRDDGAIEIAELNRGMFSDQDAYVEAIDLKYADGFHDTYSEAAETGLSGDSFGM